MHAERWILVTGRSTVAAVVADALRAYAPRMPAAIYGPAGVEPPVTFDDVPFRWLESPGMPPETTARRTSEWLRRWSNAEQADGRTLKQWLGCGSISLWWAMDAWLVESAYFVPLHEQMAALDAACEMIDREQPAHIVSVSGDAVIDDAMARASAARGVVFESRTPAAAVPVRARRRRLIAAAKIARVGVRAAIFRCQDLVFRVSRRPPADRPAALVYSGDNWQRVFNPASRALVDGDLHMSAVLPQLREHFSFAFVAYVRQYSMGLRALRAKRTMRDASGVSYRPLEAYLTLSGVWRAVRAWLRIRRVWQSLREDRRLWESLEYRDVPMRATVEERMGFFIRHIALENLLMLEASRVAVERERPAVALVAGETRWEARAIIATARAGGIPSLALQHGRFADHHYSLVPDDVTGDPATDCPLPDRFALYGASFQRQLEERGVPAERLFVTGAPRWDLASHADALFSRERTCRALGLDPGRPVVLITSSAVPDDERAVAWTCAALAEIAPACQIVVKRHPAQATDAPLRRIAARWPLLRVAVAPHAYLYELLFACDLLVTPLSTSLVDACVMRRPVMLVETPGAGGAAMFGRHPGLNTVNDEAQARETLRRLLLDPPGRQRALDDAASFAAEYAGPRDGLAHVRVAALVQDLVEASAEEVAA